MSTQNGKKTPRICEAAVDDPEPSVPLGAVPLDVADDDVKRLIEVVAEVRGTLENFDVALAVHPRVEIDDVARLGATWAMHSFWPGHRVDQIHRFIARGVPA